MDSRLALLICQGHAASKDENELLIAFQILVDEFPAASAIAHKDGWSLGRRIQEYLNAKKIRPASHSLYHKALRKSFEAADLTNEALDALDAAAKYEMKISDGPTLVADKLLRADSLLTRPRMSLAGRMLKFLDANPQA